MASTFQDRAGTTEGLYDVLVFLNGYVALTALVGGVALIADPRGSLLRLDPALLSHSGFSTFLVPGILLTICGGVLPAVTAYWLWRHRDFQLALSGLSGIILAGWIITQTILLRIMLPIHLLYLAIAVLMIGLTVRLKPAH